LLLRATACVAALCFVVLAASQAQAAIDYALYKFQGTNPSLGGGYLGEPYQVSKEDPYGGLVHTTWSRDEPYPFFPLTLDEIINLGPPYPPPPPEIQSVADLIFPPEPSDPWEVSFLSLPGDNADNNAYVIVGVEGKAIDPLGPGDDVWITERGFDGPGQEEVGYLYVSTNTVANPATASDDDFGFLFVDQVNYNRVNAIDFADYPAVLALGSPIQAIKIEGRDSRGDSFGFDLALVEFSPTSITDSGVVIIPEPTSAVLLGLGVAGLLWCRRRRGRRSRR